VFDIFKKKKPDLVKALTGNALGGQSVMYRLFRQNLGCDDVAINKLELTYFAASVMTYVYLRFSSDPNPEGSLDLFNRTLLEKSIPYSGEKIDYRAAVKKYQQRYAE
jgi:hypothetical protein